MRKMSLMTGAIIAFLMNYATASASSCPFPTPLEHIEWNEIVFYGQVDDTSDDLRDGKTRTINVKVLRAYKGVEGKSIKIKYINDGGANRGWGFQHGQSMLIFAQKDEASNGLNQIGSVNYCSMIIYHGRAQLHSQYWDHLVKMR